ncbi:hypothetical protein DV738_g124, partial [Chaetothyriales sp. CBS 135597]
MSLPLHRSSSTPAPHNPARASAPDVPISHTALDSSESSLPVSSSGTQAQHVTLTDRGIEETSRPSRSPSVTSSVLSRSESLLDSEDRAQLNAELDTRWILNLSMHFRDKSDREKFFVTYAESPNKWRRVTISCDYRNAESGSLETDLKQLQFQRDKNLMIYESIRDSLPEIQFYDTVTNLKLETSDSRLHVHVTEDVNEIIQYPARSTVAHLLDDRGKSGPKEVRESELSFESHLSGFVYKVSYHGRTCIKKEIPGPDTIDEFLYEINALHALRHSTRVIQLEAIVFDDSLALVKGLLISYAERGAVVDLLYDHRGRIPLDERLGWARDAIIGLSEIHQEGYVQGDFTLSNVVVDAEGNAKIIDINRRGCPVGWEPPEIRAKIASHQRIFMYIGEKSDLYQLGMTLWGLAADDDEPERQDLPLRAQELPDEVPAWYKEIVRICLSEQPRERWSAKDLIKLFPVELEAATTREPPQRANSELSFRRQTRYIDPSAAVEREDIDQFRNQSPNGMLAYSPQSSRDDYTFTYPRSSDYERGSATSGYERPRGRRPPANLGHLSPRERRAWSCGEPPSPADSVPEVDDDANILEITPGRPNEYEKIELEGKPFLIARNTFSDAEMKILENAATLDQSPDMPDLHTGVATDVHDDPVLRQNDVNTTSLGPIASTASDETLEHSSARAPELSGHHKAEKCNEIAPQSSIGQHSNTDRSSENLTGDYLCSPPLFNESWYSSVSALPPPLQHADSVFYEPFFAKSEAEALMCDLAGPESAVESRNANRGSGAQIQQQSCAQDSSAVSFHPPSLQRSDTAFKVGCAPTTTVAREEQTDPKLMLLNQATNSPEAAKSTDSSSRSADHMAEATSSLSQTLLSDNADSGAKVS